MAQSFILIWPQKKVHFQQKCVEKRFSPVSIGRFLRPSLVLTLRQLSLQLRSHAPPRSASSPAPEANEVEETAKELTSFPAFPGAPNRR